MKKRFNTALIFLLCFGQIIPCSIIIGCAKNHDNTTPPEYTAKKAAEQKAAAEAAEKAVTKATFKKIAAEQEAAAKKAAAEEEAKRVATAAAEQKAAEEAAEQKAAAKKAAAEEEAKRVATAAKKQSAATTIQKVFRGEKARKDFVEQKAVATTKKEEEKAAEEKRLSAEKKAAAKRVADEKAAEEKAAEEAKRVADEKAAKAAEAAEQEAVAKKAAAAKKEILNEKETAKKEEALKPQKIVRGQGIQQDFSKQKKVAKTIRKALRRVPAHKKLGGIKARNFFKKASGKNEKKMSIVPKIKATHLFEVNFLSTSSKEILKMEAESINKHIESTANSDSDAFVVDNFDDVASATPADGNRTNDIKSADKLQSFHMRKVIATLNFTESQMRVDVGGVSKPAFLYKEDRESGKKTYIAPANNRIEGDTQAQCSGEKSISEVLTAIKEEITDNSSDVKILIPLQQIGKKHWVLLTIERLNGQYTAQHYDSKGWLSVSHIKDLYSRGKDNVDQQVKKYFDATVEYEYGGDQGVTDSHNCGRYTLIKLLALINTGPSSKKLKLADIDQMINTRITQD